MNDKMKRLAQSLIRDGKGVIEIGKSIQWTGSVEELTIYLEMIREPQERIRQFEGRMAA